MGSLRVGGDDGLAHRAPALGREDIEGRGVDDPPGTGIADRGDDVAGALGVDPVEEPRVGKPLLEDAHAVERAVDSGRGGADRVGLGDVAASQLDPLADRLAGAIGVADQGHDVVAAADQRPGHRVADLACCTGDQETHQSSGLTL
jgi:hypothetical protein